MPDITLVVHNIRSSHNVGSIFRSAEGFGVKKIILSGYTPYPLLKNDDRLPHIANKLHTQIQKTALGAESLVPFEYHQTLEHWLRINEASSSPLPVLALEQAPNSVPIQNYRAPGAFALLLGEEVHGIEKRYLDTCEAILEIPMIGKKESFNVSVACGVALYALSLNSHAFFSNYGDQSI